MAEQQTRTRTPDDVADARGRVTGHVVLDHGLPAEGLVVRAYGRAFGRDELLGEATTLPDGAYAIEYPRGSAPVNLELRTLDAAGVEIPLTDTTFGAAREEAIELVAPATAVPLDAEFDRLTADLQRALGPKARLAEAKEGDGRQDLSVAAGASGWDARLVSMASLASRVADETGLAADAVYALFRAGLPTDPEALFRVPPKVVDAAWRRAADAGIVRARNGGIAAARKAFDTHARAALRATRVAGSPSTLGELMHAAGLGDDEQVAFEGTYLSGARGAALWRAAERAGVSSDAVGRLALQGKLAVLTHNNGRLTAALQDRVGSGDRLTSLVDDDLYRADAWRAQLTGLAGDDADLAALIPAAYAGEAVEDRLTAYAEDLARKVRLAFPTDVVGRLLETGEAPLERGKDVGALLRAAATEGFELGRTPVDAFFRGKRRALLAGAADGVLDDVRRVSRIFQITPGDEAMAAMLEAGFDSAQDVVAVDRDTFLARHERTLGEQAPFVYDRAHQVASVAQAVVASARVLDATVPVRAIAGDGGRQEAALAQARQRLIRQYPTMEQLFGSLDFCECEHCRSVLGPAAYLVDLLRFLDPDQRTWNEFLAEHPPPLGETYDRPYDALLRRRPDIAALPLTCENTNTTLPTIDVVNEIMEYAVATRAYAGHDTGDASSQDLLAEPQHVLAPAYATLVGAHHPIGLPFDLWFETARAFLAQLGTPLAELLETFRPTDELFRRRGDTTTQYHRWQIFAESLGLAPAEWALFERGASGAWWDLYGYASAAEAQASLASAKTLARRLGVSYRELVDLVRTSFVNPGLSRLTLLSRVGIGIDAVYRSERGAMTPAEQQAFTATLTEFETLTGFDAATWLHDRYADGTIDAALVLAEPELGCDFERTVLQYADGDPAAVVDLVKLNLFVRLWRRLGWTIEEVDRALTACIPPAAWPLTVANLGPALRTALLYLSHLDALERELALGPGARVRIPVLWSDLPTAGRTSLYAQLFLTPAVQKDDPVFDHPAGDYLSDTTLTLGAHRGAVQAALTLSAGEVDRILAAAGLGLGDRLSVPNLSVLYRHALLARALRLPIRDLIALIELTGLDPFAPIRSDPLEAQPVPPALPAPLADDHPYAQTLAFVRAARLVAASGFSIAELDHLLRQRVDPAGPYRADQRALLALVVELGASVARIAADNAPPADLAALEDDALRQMLALVLPAAVVETVMGMWRGTIQYEANAENVAAGDALDPAAMPPEATVSYDAVRGRQRLTWSGLLLDARKLVVAPNAGLLRTLLDDVAAQARTFFDAHLRELLEAGDLDVVFKPLPSAPAQARAALAARRARIAARLYPYVVRRLTRELVVSSRVTASEADPGLVEALLTDPALLADPDRPTSPLIDAFAASAEAGVTTTFYASPDATGAPLGATGTAPDLDTRGRPVGGGARSARLQTVLEVPTTGAYRFFVHVDDASTRVELRFAHLPDPVIAATAAAAHFEPSAPVELRAGVGYTVDLLVTGLGAGDVRVLVQGEALPKGPLLRLRLHPAAAVERVRRADLLLRKALRVVAGLGLDERELRHILGHGADFDGASLSRLPTDEVPAATAATNMTWLLRLADYAALKRELDLTGSDLVEIFENARHTFDPAAAADPAVAAAVAEVDLLRDLDARVARLARRDPAAVAGIARTLGFAASATAAQRVVEAPDYASERGLRRLWDALRTVEALGVPGDAIRRWTAIVDPATPSRDAVAADLRNSLKARFAPAAWLAVAQPISDGLRRRKRDALVAYLTSDAGLGLERADELYEHFLVDPGTEPVVLTSRLLLAISSVQLFVQRCLLNLEPTVPAAAIGTGDARPWEWMKRYRIWEANRKIFLYPENWLEPEFRDEKTHLFAELEGSLLQGDVTNDAAEDAFFAYLEGLEGISRLEVVSMFAEEHPGRRTLHVIGRTYATPHRYWYRRYADGTWTPWEAVGAEVEGDHVVAAVWHERLHLLWVTFTEVGVNNVKKETPRQLADRPADETVDRVVEMRVNWSAYVNGEWTARAAAKTSTVIRRRVVENFDPGSFLVYVSVERAYLDGVEELRVYVTRDPTTAPPPKSPPPPPGGTSPGAPTTPPPPPPDSGGAGTGQVAFPDVSAFVLATKNGPPQTEEFAARTPPPENPYLDAARFDATHRAAWSLSLAASVRDEAGKPATRTILGWVPSGYFRLLLADNRLKTPMPPASPALLGPLFFEDDRHTFFIEPNLVEQSMTEWDGWVVDMLVPSQVDLRERLEQLVLESAVPDLHVEPRPPDPRARFAYTVRGDWLTAQDTVVRFDYTTIGRSGGRPAGAALRAFGDGQTGPEIG